jgi:HAE1 family hydrophobic/amphiphilic exporter-1
MKADSILNRFASLMIKKYRFVYLMMIIVTMLGMFSYHGLAKEVLPELRFPYAIVSVPYPGASPEDVEKQITIKIEDAVSGTGEIKMIESVALPGLSQTIIKYKMGVDLSKKLEKVKTLVEAERVHLPKKHERPIVEEYDISKMPTMIVTISSQGTPSELKATATMMSDRLKRIEGVSKVNLDGAQTREIHIRVSGDKLMEHGISEDHISSVIKSRNVDVPAGVKTLNGKNYNIRVNNAFEDIEDIRRLIVKTSNDIPLYLEDVATVNYGYKEDETYAITPFKFRQEDEVIQRVIALNILKENGSDAIKINDEIRRVVKELQAEGHLDRTKVEFSLDMSEYIKKSIKDVFNNAVSGLLVVIIVLFFFIDFRESIIVALVIPLSMMMTVATFKYVGVSFNIMSLLGLIIALGMLVDNAIVVIESIQMARDQYDDMEKASEEATKSVAAAILASTITTVVAFLPLTFMKGDTGVLIRPIPIATSIALIASYLVSIAVTPMLAARWLKNHKNDRVWVKWLGVVLVFLMSLYAFSNNQTLTTLSLVLSPIMALAIWYKLFKAKTTAHEIGFIKAYAGRLRQVLSSKKKRVMALFASLILLIVSGFILASDLVPKEAMPTADTTLVSINYDVTLGGSLKDTEAIAMEVHQILKSKPYIKDYVARIGGNQENMGLVNVTLVHKNDRDLHSNDIILELGNELRQIPGAQFIVGSEEGESSNQVSIDLAGKSLQVLRKTAKGLKDSVQDYEGVETAWTSADNGVPQMMVDINYDKAAFLSLDPDTMSFEIASALGGEEITEVMVDEEDEKVKLFTASIKDIGDVRQLYFNNTQGQRIPFVDVARLIEKNGMGQINRKDNQKIVQVVLQLKKDVPVKSVVDQIQQAVERKEIVIEKGVTMTFGGSYKEMQEGFNDLAKKMLIAVTLIFAVLVLQFDSYKQPFVIMLAVPMALIGVSFGHLLARVQFGIMSFMGLVALSGIVVNDSIVLIDTINQNRRLHKMTYIDAIISAAQSRFIPVLATSVTTIAGVLPLALYNEDYSQMAWTLIFGLVTSTVLILALVPIILVQMEGRRITNEE